MINFPRVYFCMIIMVCLLWHSPVLSWGKSQENYQWDTLCLIWTAKYDENEQVYFSQYQQEGWSIPVQISSGSSSKFHATGTIAPNGTIWVVWTQVHNKGKFLYFSTVTNGMPSHAERINTTMGDNREAAIVIDASNSTLIAWTAIDKGYPDVFWLKGNGRKWSGAKKVHSDNNVPDGNPALLSNENGKTFLSWRTFSDGHSVRIFREYAEESWQANEQYEKSYTKLIKKRRDHAPQVPKSIREPLHATYLFLDMYGAGTLPVISR